jgi:hypothetical protein
MKDEYPYVGVCKGFCGQYSDLSGMWQSRPGDDLTGEFVIVYERILFVKGLDVVLVLSKYGLGWMFVVSDYNPIERL